MTGGNHIEAEGGCPCSAVRFRVRFAPPPAVLDCNCSVCAKTGFLHLIADADCFTLLAGADRLTEYRFGSGAARHLFCRTCGIKSFYVPRSHPDGFSVNWRALDDVGAIAPILVPFDGRGGWEAARRQLPAIEPR
jgi:hypothetical protein